MATSYGVEGPHTKDYSYFCNEIATEKYTRETFLFEYVVNRLPASSVLKIASEEPTVQELFLSKSTCILLELLIQVLEWKRMLNERQITTIWIPMQHHKTEDYPYLVREILVRCFGGFDSITSAKILKANFKLFTKRFKNSFPSQSLLVLRDLLLAPQNNYKNPDVSQYPSLVVNLFEDCMVSHW
jgi:hypothetical protein